MSDSRFHTILKMLSQADFPEREQLQLELESLAGDYERLDFKLKRTLKDKDITLNLLNRTIENLQQKNQYIEETNELLERQANELKENYRELEQFAHIASHDLKSPVRNIHSFAQLLERRFGRELPLDGQEFLSFIIRSSQRMHEVLDDLSVFSNVTGKNKAFELTDLNDILKVVKFGLSDEIERTHCLIESQDLPQLPVIRSGIYQLFLNLISNAIKFQNGNSPHIVINWEQMDHTYRFSVTDNGIGIPTAYAQKVFQPFQRLSQDKPGTGIGLAICKKVVQLHGGEIGFTPGPDEKGTPLYLHLVGLNLQIPSSLQHEIR